MSQTDVEKIKSRLGIKEVIETYIKLEKAGKNYKARCPFHNEKTPSFFVSPDRDSYYCFGCNAKGDIFTFVEQFEGTDFPGALKILADRAGVEITNNPKSKEFDEKIKALKQILETSAKYFEFNLQKNKEAIEYLKSRGLKEKTIKDWRIGFAPAGWQNLISVLSARKFSENLISQTGMIKKGEKGNYYDTFRSRIMFPICNSAGEVVAFSGRIFGPEDDESAKYINSPETDLFKKSEILYGFDKAKSSIRKNDFSILVEGQMDTVMCHQAGYKNTVASSGTALTEKQLQILSRISPKMVIAFDADSAGFKASERAWQMALSIGMDVKIAPISGGKDPAEIIKESPIKWKKIVKESKHIIDVLVEKIPSEIKDDRKIGTTVSEKIIPYLVMIESKIDRAHFVKNVSENLKIPEDAIYAEINEFKRDTLATPKASEIRKPASIRHKDYMAVEKRLFGIIAWQEKSKEKIIEISPIQEKVREILADEYAEISSAIADSLHDIIFNLENNYDEVKILKKDVKELLINLELKYLIKKREKLLLSLRELEKYGAEQESDKLLEQISEISKKIQSISRNI